MQQSPAKIGLGRARLEQGSTRRDEYGRPYMGGDFVNKEGRGVDDGRGPRAGLKDTRKVTMQDMNTASPLQLFLRNAQAKLALNDKYAQRVIIQDDKSQLTFRTVAEFTADETERMHLAPTMKLNQIEALQRSITLTNQSLEEEIKMLKLKAAAALAEENKRIAIENNKVQIARAQGAAAVLAPRLPRARGAAGGGGVTPEGGARDEESVDDDKEPAEITELIVAEREAKQLLLDSNIDNLKSKAACKIEELRKKYNFGGYADFAAYLAEWYRETVEQLYALMLGWVDYDTIQALTQKYCMHGASNATNFIVLIGVWHDRATRKDVAHVAQLWAQQRFLTPMVGHYTVDGFLSQVELIKSAAAAYPMNEHQQWICHHWLLLQRTTATYSLLQRWGAMAIADITDQ
jgi:hypothetical protein